MDLFTTLIQAREVYKDDIDNAIESSSKESIECPCCEGKVKIYTRKLNTGMAITLLKIYQYAKLDYCHVVDAQSKQCTDYPQLRHWNLIEESSCKIDGKRTSGIWKITDLGLGFLTGNYLVKKYIHTINNKLIGYSGENIGLKDCLPEDFNYQELMVKEGW